MTGGAVVRSAGHGQDAFGEGSCVEYQRHVPQGKVY